MTISSGLSSGIRSGLRSGLNPGKMLIAVLGQSNAQTFVLSSGLTDSSFGTAYPNVTHLTKQDGNTNPPVWTETTATSLGPVNYSGGNKIGIEASLMRLLDTAAPGQFVCAQYALGGTSLAINWDPNGTYPSLDPPNLFTQCVSWLRAAEANTGARVAAIVWNQGETDAGTLAYAQAYGTNLIAFVNALRAQFGNVPFVFGRLNTAYAIGAFTADVRSGQATAAGSLSNVAMVNQDSVALSGDGQHYTADGYVTLGRLYAVALAPLLGVNLPPTASFTSGTSTLTANFTDTSTDLDGTIVARYWNFGDGATSTATNPSRTYASAGTYTVTLTVADSGGRTASTSGNVTVSASTWTVDATSSKGRPLNSTEWSSFLSANSGTLSAWSSPDSVYTCQDSASPLADAVGAFSLTLSGSGAAYQQSVSGWDAKAVTLTDGTTAGFRSLSASLPDLATASSLLLAYVQMPGAAPAASRNLLILGGATLAAARLIGGTGVLSALSGANNASGATNMAGAGVVPIVLKVDRTGSVQTVYSLTEKLIPTFSASLTGKSCYLGSNGAAAGVGYLYAARWDNAKAERSDAQIKALLQALAWSPTWS